MLYDKMAMRRLMNSVPELSTEFLKLCQGTNDYGATALFTLFNTRVVVDPILTIRYKTIAGDTDPVHVTHDTPASLALQAMINQFGWREFLNAFVLLSRNKEATCLGLGLKKAAEVWDKIASVVGALPKTPQQ